MKKLLIISFSNLSSDPRVYRQIDYFHKKYEVTTIGLADPQIEGVKFYPLRKRRQSFRRNVWKAFLLLCRRFDVVYWNEFYFHQTMEILKGKSFDVIIANDVESIPFAQKIAPHKKIILDAHEYTPEEFSDQFIWKIFMQPYKTYLCTRFLNGIDRMVTVCDNIAQRYDERFGIHPEVIISAPQYHHLTPTQVNVNRIQMIYHGNVNPSRRLELMIRLMDYLDSRFILDLMLVPNRHYFRYYHALLKMAKKYSRVKILSPVTMQTIVPFTNQFDIGLCLLPPTSVNNQFALPNKFFEFIQARLMTVVGPSIEMASIVRKYHCGLVSEDLDLKKIAQQLNSLTGEQIQHYKEQSHKAARELCQERVFPKFDSILSELINR